MNESGHMTDADALVELKDKLMAHCRDSDILVLSGSAPRGVSTTIYRELLQTVSGLPIKTVLDAEGELLLHGLEGSHI